MKLFKNTHDLLNLIGYFLVGFVCFPYIIFNLLFFLNITINSLNSWLVFILYLLVFTLYFKLIFKFTIKQFIYIIFWGVLCIITSCLISNYFLDYSYDGQGYHGEAILQFANGLNPTLSKLKDNDNFIFFVINHFAKASWISGAFLFKLTTLFNCSKANTLILIFANFCIIYPFFRHFFNKIKSILFALLISFNPVALNLYLSNLLDSQIASLLFIFFILLYYMYIDYKHYILLLLIIISIYLINLKFSTIVYLGIFLFFYSIFIVVNKKLKYFWSKILILSFSFLIALFIFGYHTYTKNIIQYNHPFYPFFGDSSNATGKLPNNFPTGFVEAQDYKTGNRFINFIKSNFKATTFNQAYTQPLKYKIPFSISKYELERFAFAGVMIGGYGVWFSGAISLCFLMSIFIIYKRKKYIFNKDLVFYLFFLSLLTSILINPYGYVARYAPQYYLIPFIILIMYNLYYPNYKLIQWILITILIINSLLIMGYTYYNFIVTSKVNAQIKSIKATHKSIGINFNSSTSKRQLFIDNNIKFHPLKLNKNDIPDTLFRSEVIYKIDD